MTDAEHNLSHERQNGELTDRSRMTLSLGDFLQVVKLHEEEKPEPQERSLTTPAAFARSQEDDSDSDDDATYVPPQRQQAITPKTIVTTMVAAPEASMVLQGTADVTSLLAKYASLELEPRILTTSRTF
eukprot:TRINITY_DN1404_c0_g1_i1.p1 TRINITY_DN1404_c0_g1~~TRINITY_DN1404_c0_g1_i1.p1  ORF type:complete len:129 (-),score=13.22 TRINITY_DN1404_c0_g1_i1:133-519(-)